MRPTCTILLLCTLVNFAVAQERMILWAGSGSPGSQDGVGATAQFKFPVGLATDAQGNLYVADNGNLVIRKISYDRNVTTLAGKVGVSGVVDATGNQAQFVEPMYLAVDRQGFTFVSDNASLLRSVSPTGTVTTLAGSTQMGYVDSTASHAQFTDPHGLTLDNLGALFIADTGNVAIRKLVLASSVVSTVFSTARLLTENLSSGGDRARTIVFQDTATLSVDPVRLTSHVWLKDGAPLPPSEASGDTLQLPIPSSNRTKLAAGDAGIYQAARVIQDPPTEGVTPPPRLVPTGARITLVYIPMGGPRGVALDSSNNVCVADFGHNIVTKSAALVAGKPHIPGFADGIEITASFNGPSDLVVDADNNLYVADTNNNAIRKITPYGQVSTVIANGLPTNPINFSDVPMYVSQLNQPSGLATDKVGNLYIADTGNHRIWKFVMTPTIPKALNATEIKGTSFTANWSTVPGVTLWAHPSAVFLFDLATDVAFKNIVSTRILPGDSTSLQLTGLTPNQTYYYRVAARNEGGTGLFSNTITTVALPEPVALPPTNLASSGTFEQPLFGFSANWSSLAGAEGYELDLSTTSTFSSYVSGYQAKRLTASSLDVTGLAPGTYFYRVRGVYSVTPLLVGGNSNSIAITVLPPPEALPATNLSSGATTTTFKANWKAVPQATSYLIDVALDTSFQGAVSSDAGNATSFNVVGLKGSTTYYYRIRAAYSAPGVSSTPSTPSNQVSVFTVILPPEAIAASNLGSTASSIEFTANWKPVDTATGYMLDIARDDAFQNMLNGYSSRNVGTATSLRVTGLEEKTTYYYRVRAVSTSSTSIDSNTISVKTQAMSTSETIKQAVGGGKGGGAPSLWYFLVLCVAFASRFLLRNK